jgi:hypothetical protein
MPPELTSRSTGWRDPRLGRTCTSASSLSGPVTTKTKISDCNFYKSIISRTEGIQDNSNRTDAKWLNLTKETHEQKCKKEFFCIYTNPFYFVWLK